MGLFSGSKKQTVTNLQTSAANYGAQSGNSGRISTYESSATNITEVVPNSVDAAVALAGNALATVAQLADRSQTLQLATVDTLTNLGSNGVGQTIAEQGATYSGVTAKSNTGLYVAAAVAALVMLRA